MSLILVWRVLMRLLVRGRSDPLQIFRVRDDGPLRPPFEAPVRIATHGDRSGPLYNAIRNWKLGPPPIDDAALVVIHAEQIADFLFEPRQHIIVVHDCDLADLLDLFGTLDRAGERLPRLIVCARERRLAPFLDVRRIPAGVALLMVPAKTVDDLVPALLEEIGRNVSLERAVRDLHPPRSSVLILSPAGNHALRFHDLEDMTEIDARLAGAGFQERPWAPSEELPGITRESGRQSYLDLAGRRMAVLKLQFPYVSDAEGRPAPRALDVNVLRGSYRARLSRLLPRSTTLLAGADYFLRVNVGVNAQPSASAGYRYEGGRLIEIVLQEKGFDLRTARSQFVYLPASGPSKPVLLGVRTPAQWGTAQLRISAYLRNQLVETLSVEAEIADEEYRLEAADRGVVAKVEFTQTDGFTDLAELPERALSISVNRENAATHTLMVKGEQGAHPFSVPESLVGSTVKNYRELLETATTRDGRNPRFPTGKLPDPALSNQYLADLADLGEGIYDGCFHEDDHSVRAMLNSVRDSSDRVISVVRQDPRFAFPWQIVYDYQLPTRFILKTPKVCRGLTESGAPCGHTHESKVYCVRGFWGYRHQIEELMSGNRPRLNTVTCPAASAVQYVVSTKDKFTDSLVAELGKLGAASVSPGGTLLDALAAPVRPAVVIVLGHLEQTGLTTGPVGPRIVLERDAANASSAWLVSRELSNRFRDHPWGQPNAIVMLMVCESAATNPETLYDFVMGFQRARAAAVVGVECRAFSGLLAQFAEEVSAALWNQTRLGEAMLDFRRKLLHTGHPLAFIFTAIGCADVKLVRMP